VNQLQAHRLDVVLADEPASSVLKAKTFNHRLGRSGVTFCAVPAYGGETAQALSPVAEWRSSALAQREHGNADGTGELV
jgi:hypothetical protein